MNKTLLSLLTVMLLAIANLPGTARAAAGDHDYVALRVPDLPQAVGFFRETLNCEVISENTATDAPPSALLDCGRGTTVELFPVSAARVARPPAATGFAFVTDDAFAAARWLRSRHVAVVGQPTRAARGPNAGRIVVTFLTPWGQPLQMVGRDSGGAAHEKTAGVRFATE